MLRQIDIRRGSLSFYFRGMALFNPRQWTPNVDVVRIIVKYVIATGRLKAEPD